MKLTESAESKIPEDFRKTGEAEFQREQKFSVRDFIEQQKKELGEVEMGAYFRKRCLELMEEEIPSEKLAFLSLTKGAMPFGEARERLSSRIRPFSLRSALRSASINCTRGAPDVYVFVQSCNFTGWIFFSWSQGYCFFDTFGNSDEVDLLSDSTFLVNGTQFATA